MRIQLNKYWQIVILVAVTGLLYWKSLGNQFQLKWDDQWMVFNPYTENGLTLQNIGNIFTELYHGQFSPLNQFIYTIIHELAGYNPAYYHGFCILLHILNVVIVYLFVKALLSAMKPDSNVSVNVDKYSVISSAAFFAALIFAIHPVNVESVSWISASKIPLCSFNYLLALYLYIRFIKSESRLLYIAILILFTLSFGGKEQAATFIFSLLTIDYVLRRKESILSLTLEKFPIILLTLFFGLITMMTHWHSGSSTMPVYESLLDKTLLCCYSIVQYIVKIIIPYNLSYVYPFPYMPGTTPPLGMYIYPVIMVTILSIILHYRKNRITVFALLFFISNLAFMLHIIPMGRFTVICDRYLYVAIIGPATLFGWFFANLIYKRNKLGILVLSLYVLYLSSNTFTYQDNWYDSSTLKEEVRDTLRERNRIIKEKRVVKNVYL